MKFTVYCLLFIIGMQAAAQDAVGIMQPNAANLLMPRGAYELGFRLPRVCNPTGTPKLLNLSYWGSKGAMVYDSCNNKIKVWNGTVWDSLGGTTYTDAQARAALSLTTTGTSGAATYNSGTGVLNVPNYSSTSGINYIPTDSGYVGVNSGPGQNGTDAGANNTHNFLAGARTGFNMGAGSFNVGIGFEALYNNTLGSGNFALGRRSLYTNTGLENVSSRNIAIGDSAKFGLTGNDNVAIGTNALKVGGTNQNVAIGSYALENLPGTGGCSDCGWVGIGYQAGRAITASLSLPSIIIGGYAAYRTPSVWQSVIIGPSAYSSASVSSISNTVVIGHSAAANATSASVFAIGYSAANSITSGSGLFIGNSANGTALSNSQLVIGNGNSTAGQQQIAIGANVTTSGNRQIAIGSNSSGELSTNIGWGNAALTGTGNTLLGGIAFGTGGGSGSYNTAVGALAGYARTVNGSNNIFMGRDAARSGAAGTITASELIYIGYTDLLNVSTSNQLVIGGNRVNWITRFPGTTGQYLLNTTNAAVSSATASTALEINGVLGAVLLPRLTTTERNALTATNGHIIYNVTTAKFQGYAGGAWVDLH